MPLDPVIAQGFRGIQLQDPLEQYARANQLLQAQQQNQLNALKMQEYQREREVENKLAQLFQRPGADPTSPEFMREVYGISPLKGAAFQKSALETQKAQREADAAAEKLAAERVAGARALLPSVTPETWGAWREDTIRKLPGLASMIPETYSEDARLRLMQTADQYLAERKPLVVSPGASVYRPGTTTPMFTAPTAERPYEPSETQKILADLKNPALTPQERAGLEARLRILTTREPKEPRPEAAPRTKEVTMSDGTIGIMNMDTGEVTPASLRGAPVKGKPSAFAEKTAAQRKQLGLDLDRAIAELTDAAKDDGLIDQSTGSGFGRLVDVGAGFVGQATPGAIAAGKLAPIADLALKMVPRFEGPQSNMDTKSYKEAAGQLADSTLPNKIRKEAAKTVVRLMRERKGQFASPEMVSAGAAQDTGVDTSNPLLK